MTSLFTTHDRFVPEGFSFIDELNDFMPSGTGKDPPVGVGAGVGIYCLVV